MISGMGHSRRPSRRNPISRPEDIFYRKVDVGEGAENTFCERHEVGWPMKRAAVLPVTDGNGIRGEKLVTPWIFLRTALCIRAVIRFVRSSGKPGRKRPPETVWTRMWIEVMLRMWTQAVVSTWSDDGHLHSIGLRGSRWPSQEP